MPQDWLFVDPLGISETRGDLKLSEKGLPRVRTGPGKPGKS